MFKGYAIGFLAGLEDDDVDYLVGILEDVISSPRGFTAAEKTAAMNWLDVLRPLP